MAFKKYIKKLKDEDNPILVIWTYDLSQKQNSNQCLIQLSILGYIYD